MNLRCWARPTPCSNCHLRRSTGPRGHFDALRQQGGSRFHPKLTMHHAKQSLPVQQMSPLARAMQGRVVRRHSVPAQASEWVHRFYRTSREYLALHNKDKHP